MYFQLDERNKREKSHGMCVCVSSIQQIKWYADGSVRRKKVILYICNTMKNIVVIIMIKFWRHQVITQSVGSLARQMWQGIISELSKLIEGSIELYARPLSIYTLAHMQRMTNGLNWKRYEYIFFSHVFISIHMKMIHIRQRCVYILEFDVFNNMLKFFVSTFISQYIRKRIFTRNTNR